MTAPGGSGGSSGKQIVNDILLRIQTSDAGSPERKALVDSLLAIATAGAQVNAALTPLVTATNAAAAAQANLNQQAKEAEKSIPTLVSQYNSATKGAELYGLAMSNLDAESKTLTATDAATKDRLIEVGKAFGLAATGSEQYEEVLSKLPAGIGTLSDALAKARDEIKAEADAAKAGVGPNADLGASVSTMVKQYDDAVKQIELFTRVQAELDKNVAGQSTGTGTPSADTMQSVAAYNLAGKALDDYKQKVDGLPPELQKLSAALKQVQADMKAEADAAKTPPVPPEAPGIIEKYGQVLDGLGRGLASSLFGFSIIAGGIVAVGHVIGNAINDTVEAFEKLQKEINDLAAVNPSLNTDTLFAQITDIEQRMGVLSDKLVAIYQVAVGVARGNQEAATQLTETLAGGAKGSQQDPAAWAEAATQTLKAYGLTLSDVTHVQDVMTLAMQDSDGQAKTLLDSWALITKAASLMNTPLDETASIMTVLAQNGGDLELQLRSLKTGFDALITTQTQDQLTRMGVDLTDAHGNAASLVDILGQLKTLMTGWSTSDIEGQLRKIFPGRGVSDVMATLLLNYDQINAGTKTYSASMGEADEQLGKFNTTAQAHAEKLDAITKSIEENAGAFLDWKRDIAGIIVDSQSWNITGGQQPTGPTFSDAALKDYQEALKLAGDKQNEFGAGTVVLTEQQGREIVQEHEQADVMRALTQARANETAATNDQITAGNQWNATLGMTSEQTKALTDWQGKLVTSASGLTESMKGVTPAFNDFITSAETVLQGNAFGGFASQAEQNLAMTNEQISGVIAKIKDLGNELRGAASQGMGPDSPIWALTDQYAQQKSLLTDLIAKAKEYAQQIYAESPAGKKEALQQLYTGIDTAATEKIAADQAEATKVADGYKDAIAALNTEQNKYQSILREDSTPELAAARRDLTAATDDLYNITQKYDGELLTLRKNLLDAKDAAKGVLDPAKQSMDDAQKALDDFNTKTSDIVDAQTTHLHELQQAQKKVKDDQEALVHAAQQYADDMTAAYDKLREEMRLADEGYKNQEGDLERQLQLLDRMNNATLTDLKTQIQALKNAIDDLTHQEDLALRPLQDQLYGKQVALDSAKDAVQAVSDKYAYLNGLQAEYDGLKQQELQIKQQEDLLNKKDTEENLAARLQSAKKGTSEYIQLQQQLVKAKNDSLLTGSEYNLQNQIAAGKAAEKADMDAAKAREQQAQKEYDDTKRQIEAVKQKYDVEKRDLQDQMASKQRDYNDDQVRFAQQHTDLQNRIEDLKEEQRQYDENKQHDIDAAQAVANAAKADLATAKEVQYQANLAQSKIVDDYTTWMTKEADLAKKERDDLQGSLDWWKNNYNTLKTYWDGVVAGIQSSIDHTSIDATTFEDAAKAKLKTVSDHYKDLHDAIQKIIDHLGDQINTERDIATNAENSTKRQIDAERAKQQAFRDTWTLLQAYKSWVTQTDATVKMPEVTAPYVPPNIPPGQGGMYHPPDVYDPRSPTPPGQVGHHSVGFMPVPIKNQHAVQSAATAASSGGAQGGGMSISIGSMTVQMGADTSGRPGESDERYYARKSASIVRGLRKGLRDQFGIEIETVIV